MPLQYTRLAQFCHYITYSAYCLQPGYVCFNYDSETVVIRLVPPHFIRLLIFLFVYSNVMVI